MRVKSNTFQLLIILLLVSGCGGGTGPQSSTTLPPGSNPVNRAPVISGLPPEVVGAGEVYDFTPAASDPDGDALTFGIVNLPLWLAFDSTSGQLTGTPSSNDLGTYDGIEITVSDGGASAALPPFAISVNSGQLRSITLTWTAPTVNTDGTALTDLAGYIVYFGENEQQLSRNVRVENPGISRYVVDGLNPGSYTFVVASYNAAGVESAYSNSVQRVILQ